MQNIKGFPLKSPVSLALPIFELRSRSIVLTINPTAHSFNLFSVRSGANLSNTLS